MWKVRATEMEAARNAARRDLAEAVEVLRELVALNGHLAITERKRFLTSSHERRITPIVARHAKGGEI